MIELIFVAISVIVGFIAGWKYREYTAIKNINDAMQHVNNNSVIHIKVERVGDQIFVYNKATSEYMAHASNREILEMMLRDKFPGKTFGASSEDIGKLDESV